MASDYPNRINVQFTFILTNFDCISGAEPAGNTGMQHNILLIRFSQETIL